MMPGSRQKMLKPSTRLRLCTRFLILNIFIGIAHQLCEPTSGGIRGFAAPRLHLL